MTPILALDLGKYRTVSCAYTPADGTARFAATPTTVDHLARLIDQEQPELVVCETGTPAGWVHDLCIRLGVRCLVANPDGEAWRWKNVKRKTDRDDALKLARLSKRGPGLLRKLLVEASWVMIRYNPWAAEFVRRVSRGQKTRRKQTVVALARKVLVRCWAMLRDRTDWRPPAAGPVAA